MKDGIRVVSLDMDGTLVDPTLVDRFWHGEVPRLYAEKEGISWEEARRLVRREYDRIGEEDLRWYLPEYWFDLFGLQESPREVIARYRDEVQVYPEVPEVLEGLRERYQLVLSSNAADAFIETEIHSIRSYFTHLFSSTSHFGEVKKGPRFYSRVCSLLRVEPREVLHVGDHWIFDYLSPRELGMRAFYLDRKGGREGREVIRDLRELEERLL
jgi:putative hydrolase of the HAD superfamily